MSNHPTRLTFYFPTEKHHLLYNHVQKLGTTISERARKLLLADMENSDDYENSPQVYGD